jgi:hypothetical protein
MPKTKVVFDTGGRREGAGVGVMTMVRRRGRSRQGEEV